MMSHTYPEDKLTVLDQFAIAAMQSIMLMDNAQRLIEFGTTDISVASYLAAQVMMAERGKQ